MQDQDGQNNISTAGRKSLCNSVQGLKKLLIKCIFMVLSCVYMCLRLYDYYSSRDEKST